MEMKKLLAFLLISTVSPALFAQGTDSATSLPDLMQQHANAPFNREMLKEMKDSGKLDKSGKKTGWWIEYIIDTMQLPASVSMTKMEGSYLNNKREGEWKYYKSYDKDKPANWTLDETRGFKDGLLDGYVKKYSGDKVFNEQLYSKGIKNGKSVGYYSNGIPDKELNFKNDTLDGIQKLYYENGNLRSEANVTMGKYNGEYLEYFESGKLKRALHYANDTINGTETVYNEQGVIISELQIKNEVFDGECKYYHDNGTLWTIRTFKAGNLWEVPLNQDKHGKKLDPGSIKEGNGTVNIYDENGALSDVWIVQDGKVKQ